jgi:hypothetical protein
MSNIESTTTSTETSHFEFLVLTSWSKVFDGACGRFLILCFFLSLALFVTMIAYVGAYVGSVLNDPNIICVPFFLSVLMPILPIVLTLWFLATLGSICVVPIMEEAHMCCRIFLYLSTYSFLLLCTAFFSIFVVYSFDATYSHFNGLSILIILFIWAFLLIFGLIWIEVGIRDHTNCRMCPYTCSSVSYCVIFILLLTFTSVFSEHGVIIKENNSSNMMFQYLGNGLNPTAYSIIFRRDGIDEMFPSSACKSVPFSTLCPIFGPLRDTDLSRVLKCQPNAESGLEFPLFYLRSLMELSRITINIGITFAIFFAFGCVFILERRFLPSKKWIENRFCWSFSGEPNEGTRLI